MQEAYPKWMNASLERQGRKEERWLSVLNWNWVKSRPFILSSPTYYLEDLKQGMYIYICIYTSTAIKWFNNDYLIKLCAKCHKMMLKKLSALLLVQTESFPSVSWCYEITSDQEDQRETWDQDPIPNTIFTFQPS